MFVPGKHILSQLVSMRLQSAVMRAQILTERHLISTPSEVWRLQYMLQILKLRNILQALPYAKDIIQQVVRTWIRICGFSVYILYLFTSWLW